jgi:NTE family protein
MARKRFLPLSILICLAFFSCRAVPTPPPVPSPPVPITAPPSPPPAKPMPRIALVLGGGAARGFAHVGVIRVLEQEKIPIDMIIGTSAGSLVGAIYASERDLFQLEWMAYQMKEEDLFDFSIVYSKMGPVQGEKLEEFIRSRLKVKNLEDLTLPLYPVATDLMTGETVTLEKGSIARAVRASSAIPGIFVPVRFAGRTLVDGGVTDNVPVDIAAKKGADLIIAVNISKGLQNTQISSVVDVILQSIDIMGRELLKYKKQGADVLIEPAVGDVGMMDFSQRKRCIEAGIRATQGAVPQIRQKIEAWRAGR